MTCEITSDYLTKVLKRNEKKTVKAAKVRKCKLIKKYE